MRRLLTSAYARRGFTAAAAATTACVVLQRHPSNEAYSSMQAQSADYSRILKPMTLDRMKAEDMILVQGEDSPITQQRALAAKEVLVTQLESFHAERLRTNQPLPPPLTVDARMGDLKGMGVVFTISFTLPQRANHRAVLASLVEADGVPLRFALQHWASSEADGTGETLSMGTRCGDFFLRQENASGQMTLSFMTLALRTIEAERVVLAYRAAHGHLGSIGRS
uniref:Uncharacterized protein n=1 Tax=Coccolithus braarudii TaxID=221442 RepID=A0A7S0PX35_9EUKA|mmetsp:Transcript_10255/g.22271  ORF Transcript_10255/g.22271 Transcript_10255/m.22271 type:complete len:224 (+) Transcript_10255:69-740(+)